MDITPTGLTKAAAVCAAAAGAIFVAVQINHPAPTTFLSDTNEWVMRGTAKTVMAPLALAGITGIYLRQFRQMRLLGLVGFVLFAGAYLLVFATESMSVFMLPALTGKVPAFVNDVVVAGNTAGSHTGGIGPMHILFNLMGVGYILGGLIFGIALFRARVLVRWAAVLLALSTVSTVALAVLPESFNRPLAVPEGIALVALGVSLWRNPASDHDAASISPSTTSESTRAVLGALEHPAVR